MSQYATRYWSLLATVPGESSSSDTLLLCYISGPASVGSSCGSHFTSGHSTEPQHLAKYQVSDTPGGVLDEEGSPGTTILE